MRLQDLFARLWNTDPGLPRQRQRRVPLLMALEPRIMFDAAVAATAEPAANAHSSAHPPEAAVPAGDSHAVEPAGGPSEGARGAQGNAAAGAQARHEVVFVDPDVQDYQALLQHLPSGTEVVVLDASSDGLAQMAHYLQGRHGLDAIHLISEGHSGGIKLGSSWIDGDTLSAHAADLQGIGAALAEQGDLLLYGCKVAEGAQGQAFIDSLARLSGADVAASSDWTGAAALGGNWTLERQSGVVESRSIVDVEAASAYSHLLNTLDAGDIVVTGWNALTDTVTMMTLVDIAPGTVIKITDKGWNLNATPTAAFTTITTGDGVVTWTIPPTSTTGIGAGTVLSLFLGGSDQATTLTNRTTGADLSSEITHTGFTVADPMLINGDGIFIYQDADTNPYFISGFNNSAGTVDATNWNTSIAVRLRDSMLPNGNGSQNALVAGVNGDAIGAPRDSNGVQQDNVQYTGPTGAADRAEWLHRITDQVNWTGDNSGASSSSVVTNPGTVVPPNVAPVIGLLGGDTVSYGEGDSFVVLDAGSDATVSDADSANFDAGRLTVSLANPIAGEDVLAVRNEGSGAGQIGVSGTTISFGGVGIGSASGGTGAQDLVIELNANATAAATQALMRNLVYTNTNTNTNGVEPTAGVRTVLVSLDDGDGGSVTTTPISVNVVAVNDAPVDQVPSAQRVTHDSVLVFGSGSGSGSGNGNALSVSDVDAGNSPVRVTLTATNGVLTLSRTTGLTMLVGSGANDASMSFEGPLADINAALEGLAFTPTPGFVGPASVQIDSNDLGATGSGEPRTDSDIVGITVDPDRPRVASVHAANADGTYKVADTITLTITFDQIVTVDTTAGTPTLLLETGAIDRNASYVAGSGSQSLSFRYVVQAGDSSPDLDYAGATALQLNGATLRNSDGTDALLALPPAGSAGSIAGQQQIVVDAIAAGPSPSPVPPSPSPAPSPPPSPPTPSSPSPPPVPSAVLPLPVMPAPATALDTNARLASDATPVMALPSDGPGLTEAADSIGTLGGAASSTPLTADSADYPSLLLNPRIGEFTAVPGEALYIGLPTWVTMRSNAMNPIRVEARLAEGRPLPDWLRFDPVAGTITGRAPPDANQTLHIELIAHDPRGERASSFLDLEVKPPPPGTGALQKGRPSLSEQFDRRDAAGHRIHAALLRYEASRHRTQ